MKAGLNQTAPAAELVRAYEWNTLPWKQFERDVFELQKRIYRAASRGNVKATRRLQRLVITSTAARHIAVRRVTQDNQGKKTAGVDGVKAVPPAKRLAMAEALRLDGQARPLRRVEIPKPGTSETRGLGIPTMIDRAKQALAKLALEPEWEARFEPNSYGFRPGRSTHDAIEHIRVNITQNPKWVLDADISKCFDRINHEALLAKLNTFPLMRRQVNAWLKSGVMVGPELFPTDEGTPQGGVISPLLANVALHGLEEAITSHFPASVKKPDPQPGEYKYLGSWRPVVIRYADDFVILHRDRNVVEEAQQVAADWLSTVGLELKPSKTRIANTLDPDPNSGENPGFDFLGFNIRHHRVGKYRTGTRHVGGRAGRKSVPLGFKTIITPSKKSQKQHHQELRRKVWSAGRKSVDDLVHMLNPAISGWSRYFSRCQATATFSREDFLLWQTLFRWAKQRHPQKNVGWIIRRYWRSGPRKHLKWDFGGPTVRLNRHTHTRIEEHSKVQGRRSPFDGDWIYWTSRLGRYPDLPGRIAVPLKRQKGRCAWCRLYFKPGDLIESDHKVPKSLGGSNGPDNRQALHRHCHDEKTRGDGSLPTMGRDHRDRRTKTNADS